MIDFIILVFQRSFSIDPIGTIGLLLLGGIIWFKLTWIS